jgi:hypothetical protein
MRVQYGFPAVFVVFCCRRASGCRSQPRIGGMHSQSPFPTDAPDFSCIVVYESLRKFCRSQVQKCFFLFVILFSDFRSKRKQAPKMAGLKPELLQAVVIHFVLCCFLWSSKAEEENSKDHENIRM